MPGTLGCFCGDQYKEHGMHSAFIKYRKDGYEKTVQEDDMEEKQICYEYVLFDKLADYFHIFLAISIIIINSIFYAIIIPLVSMIGYHRRTIEVLQNCNLIVTCFLLDMLFLPIMVGMNLKEFSITRFKGRHTDFDS